MERSSSRCRDPLGIGRRRTWVGRGQSSRHPILERIRSARRVVRLPCRIATAPTCTTGVLLSVAVSTVSPRLHGEDGLRWVSGSIGGLHLGRLLARASAGRQSIARQGPLSDPALSVVEAMGEAVALGRDGTVTSRRAGRARSADLYASSITVPASFWVARYASVNRRFPSDGLVVLQRRRVRTERPAVSSGGCRRRRGAAIGGGRWCRSRSPRTVGRCAASRSRVR